ncbi:hypothetical protein BaRGS_00012650, partial [Batillaria attramentaria]
SATIQATALFDEDMAWLPKAILKDEADVTVFPLPAKGSFSGSGGASNSSSPAWGDEGGGGGGGSAGLEGTPPFRVLEKVDGSGFSALRPNGAVSGFPVLRNGGDLTGFPVLEGLGPGAEAHDKVLPIAGPYHVGSASPKLRTSAAGVTVTRRSVADAFHRQEVIIQLQVYTPTDERHQVAGVWHRCQLVSCWCISQAPGGHSVAGVHRREAPGSWCVAQVSDGQLLVYFTGTRWSLSCRCSQTRGTR